VNLIARVILGQDGFWEKLDSAFRKIYVLAGDVGVHEKYKNGWKTRRGCLG
jgi:hypothetical protein